MEEPITFTVGVIVLVIWGIGSVYMGKHAYQGGFSSVIGAFLVGGVFIGISKDYESGNLVFTPGFENSFLSYGCVLLVGILLMALGHRAHKRRTTGELKEE